VHTLANAYVDITTDLRDGTFLAPEFEHGRSCRRMLADIGESVRDGHRLVPISDT
jgi:hypothetical protein